ncbi:hypothetical protein CHS0354_010123 [Potamilus streckersoni]|uniref:EF-hand domain-containing protein n=1 Tax=Potamilus streckersoni TaxID=2493646 RepID=A0AAE0RSC4_9BIVA|nr:hypothetical protein CHS0354_010123 [Potamilus streckersoni]
MDYLITKWKIWYNSLDVNHDGTISMEDVEESRQKFTSLHHLAADQGKKVEKNFEEWWNKYIFRGKTGNISQDEFVDALKKQFSADKAKFVNEMTECFNTFFDVIDTNKDRSISEDEFLIAFKAYGHENVALDSKFFQAYNPIDGLVPLRKIVESWIQFVTSEDSSITDVVKNAFEAGV